MFYTHTGRLLVLESVQLFISRAQRPWFLGGWDEGKERPGPWGSGPGSQGSCAAQRTCPSVELLTCFGFLFHIKGGTRQALRDFHKIVPKPVFSAEREEVAAAKRAAWGTHRAGLPHLFMYQPPV